MHVTVGINAEKLWNRRRTWV